MFIPDTGRDLDLGFLSISNPGVKKVPEPGSQNRISHTDFYTLQT
jgi:hypothetical protein